MTWALYYWWERWGNWVIDNQRTLTASLLLKQLKCFPLKCNLYLLPQQIQSKTEMQPILLQWWRVNILENKVITEFLSTNYWLPSRTRCREVILINHSCNQAVIMYSILRTKYQCNFLGLEGKYHLTDSNLHTNLVSRLDF